jgi:hypothetical protein
MAILIGALVTGCGSRSTLLPPPPLHYVVLFPISVGGYNNLTHTLALWHSRTKTISTVGTYDLQQAAMTFDGRFIAIERCVADVCSQAGVLDVRAPDGTIVWSQSETTGPTPWGWLGAIRPDGQRVLVATVPDNSIPYEVSNLSVLDRQSTPVHIVAQNVEDVVTHAAYSPDGQTLVTVHTYVQCTPGTTIETQRDDGTPGTALTGLADYDANADYKAPSFSFDGAAVVYEHLHDHVCDVDVTDVASRATRTAYSGDDHQCSYYSPHFTPDGSAIVIREFDDNSFVQTLRRIDLATGETSILWQGQLGAQPWLYDVSVAADD